MKVAMAKRKVLFCLWLMYTQLALPAFIWLQEPIDHLGQTAVGFKSK